MTNLTDRLRDALQAIINNEGDGEGWSLGQFVVVMGLERMNDDGQIEATAWYWTPHQQAEWMTVGLLETAIEIRSCSDVIDEP
jgi:hypothetical protein